MLRAQGELKERIIKTEANVKRLRGIKQWLEEQHAEVEK
jgi:hypothetical protein